MGIEEGTSSWENCKVRAIRGGKEGGIRNRKNGENKRGKDDAAERRRTRRELKREGEK